MKRKTLYFLLFLALISSILRFIYPSLTIFDHETISYFDTARSIGSGNIVLYGYHISETLGPSIYYIYYILSLISSNYLMHVYFVALLNVLAVVISFFFVKKFLNTKIAVFSSLLYATSIWHLFYSRFVWNPNYIPFLAVLFFYGMFSSVVNKEHKFILLSFASFGLMLHFHLSALLLAPLFLFYIKFLREKIFWKYFSVGILLFIITLLPMIIYSLSIGENLITRSISYGFVQEKSSFISNVFEAVVLPFILTTPFSSNYFSSTENLYHPIINIFIYLAVFIIFIFLIFGLIKMFRKIKDPKYQLLISSLLIVILLYILRNKSLSPHYFLILYPINFIITGLGIDELLRYKFKKVLYYSFIFVILLNVIIFSLTLIYLYKNGGTDGAYGILYKTKLDAALFVKYTNEKNIIFYKHTNLGFPEIFKNLNYDVNIIYVDNYEDLIKLNGIVILDKYSHIGRKDITKQEKEFFSSRIIKDYNNKMQIIKI